MDRKQVLRRRIANLRKQIQEAEKEVCCANGPLAGPRDVPWYYITVADHAGRFLRGGGEALLNRYGYQAPHSKNIWLLAKDAFKQFAIEAEELPGGDVEPYWFDEMWNWNEVQHMLLRWGYR